MQHNGKEIGFSNRITRCAFARLNCRRSFFFISHTNTLNIPVYTSINIYIYKCYFYHLDDTFENCMHAMRHLFEPFSQRNGLADDEKEKKKWQFIENVSRINFHSRLQGVERQFTLLFCIFIFFSGWSKRYRGVVCEWEAKRSWSQINAWNFRDSWSHALSKLVSFGIKKGSVNSNSSWWSTR